MQNRPLLASASENWVKVEDRCQEDGFVAKAKKVPFAGEVDVPCINRELSSAPHSAGFAAAGKRQYSE